MKNKIKNKLISKRKNQIRTLEKTSFKNKGYVDRYWGFTRGSDGKESACNVGVLDSIPGSRRFPGERNGYPLRILAWRIPDIYIWNSI